MNKIIYVFILTILIACGGDKQPSTESIIEKGNLKLLREKRASLVSEATNLSKEIELIDKAIENLDGSDKLALVSTIKVNDTIFNHFLELQASVQTKENILLSAEYGGILNQVFVIEGQKVNQGQILAKIDDGGLSQQLAQLQIQANLAKTTFERQQNLWNQKIGSEIQYLQAKSNYEAQVKAVSQLKSQLAKTIIKAPFSGTIDDIISEKGTTVAPGSPVLRLVNLGNMYLEAEVPEKYTKTIKKGTEVIVDFPVINESFNATVSQASNYINPGNRSFNIQIKVPNKDGLIKPNLSAKINIKDYTNPKVIIVPTSILSENADGEQYIYLAQDIKKDNTATAKKVVVKTGLSQGNMIEVLEGIKDGDQIIKEGARSVKDGQKITIIK